MSIWRRPEKIKRHRKKILSELEEKLRRSPKELIGNKGYRRYLKVELATRPIFHRKASHVKGHVFCSYRFASLTTSLALCLLIALRKSLREHSPVKALIWDDVIRDLRSFRAIKATFSAGGRSASGGSGKTYLMRTEFKGTAHRCFSAGSIGQSVGLKPPPTIWRLSPVEGEM
ncbi:MAG: hypothetical protein KAX39_02760 [candidate division Zixibacteria bacterium]|nr:hypothetical protein [candidate division Zixibacteria bacterium]